MTVDIRTRRNRLETSRTMLYWDRVPVTAADDSDSHDAPIACADVSPCQRFLVSSDCAQLHIWRPPTARGEPAQKLVVLAVSDPADCAVVLWEGVLILAIAERQYLTLHFFDPEKPLSNQSHRRYEFAMKIETCEFETDGDRLYCRVGNEAGWSAQLQTHARNPKMWMMD